METEERTYPKRTQTPIIAFTNQSEDARKVVRKDNGAKPATVDQPRRLEDLLVLLRGELRRQCRGIGEGSTFVYLEQLLRDVLSSPD